jgi:hypothetical protein
MRRLPSVLAALALVTSTLLTVAPGRAQPLPPPPPPPPGAAVPPPSPTLASAPSAPPATAAVPPATAAVPPATAAVPPATAAVPPVASVGVAPSAAPSDVSGAAEPAPAVRRTGLVQTLDLSSRKDLLRVGGATFALGYLLMPFFYGDIALVGQMVCDKQKCDSGPNLGLLFVPVAGPVLYRNKHDPGDSLTGYFLISGIQVAGLAIAAYGLIAGEPPRAEKSGFMISPFAAPGGAGAMASGQF